MSYPLYFSVSDGVVGGGKAGYRGGSWGVNKIVAGRFGQRPGGGSPGETGKPASLGLVTCSGRASSFGDHFERKDEDWHVPQAGKRKKIRKGEF